MKRQGQPKKVKIEPFRLKVTIGSDLYSSTGDNALDCLEKIKPKRFAGQGIFELMKGGNLAHLRVFGMRTERIFTKQVDKELFAKRLMILL